MPAPARCLASCLLLVLAILAVGCGGGEEAGTIPESSSTTAAPAGSSSKGEEQEPFRGGEASIEDFGEEAGGSDRAAILVVFEGYLNALAEEDFATACSYLASTVHRSLEQFAPPQLRAKGCPALLPKLLAPTVPAIAREQVEGEITKVRVEGDQAFVVFHAPGAELYQLPMASEGGEWRAALVAASVLVPKL